jgi:arylsulfatase A-like enzyme
VLVADHGEAWGQHGWFTHGYQGYEEFLEVPLILHQPGAAPKIDARPVALLDVGPTVLDLLGLPAYGNHQGKSLLGDDVSSIFWAYSNSAARLTTMEIGPWKYTENLLTTEATLFHMERDADERDNVAYEPEHAERRAALRFLLHEGQRLQLGWARELRAQSTASLLGTAP